MIKEIQLRITLKEEKRSDILLIKAAHVLNLDKNDITGIKVLRKSIDARMPKIILNYKIAVYKKKFYPKPLNTHLIIKIFLMQNLYTLLALVQRACMQHCGV